jgi:FkbM family methyltransferase
MKLTLRQYLGRIAHIYRALFRRHHKPMYALLASYIPKDGVVFDVGGHAGQFAKLFAHLAPEGAVFVFEPARYARSILQIMAGLKNYPNLFVLPFGLGETPGEMALNVPVKKKGNIGFGLSFIGEKMASDGRFSAVMAERVFITTIDTMAEVLALKRLDFIKADIEGFEFFMLKGAQETLKKFHPPMMLELTESSLSRHGQKIKDVFAFMASLGYTAHFLNETHGTLSPADPDTKGGDFVFLPA